MIQNRISWSDLPVDFLLLKTEKKILDLINPKPWPIQCFGNLYQSLNDKLSVFYSDFFKTELSKFTACAESAEPYRGSKAETAPIRMLWLQGPSNVPEELLICINSIRAHSCGHPVNLLSLSDAKELVDIPSYLISLYESGQLRPALLCDYIRAALLERYGGIWLDTSVLLIHDLPSWILNVPFWSVKGLDYFPFSPVVPDGRRWQIYAMAGQPHALFYKAFCELFLEYVQRIDTSIDYFMSYQISYLLRENVPAIAASYERVPNNNSKCESLQAYLQGYQPVRSRGIQSVFNDDTFLYKLSRYDAGLIQNAAGIIDDLKKTKDLIL